MGSLQTYEIAISHHPALLAYTDACAAIAHCAEVDKVAGIGDATERLSAYLYQAGNKKLSADDAKIRARAEWEAGKLLITLKEQGLLAAQGRPVKKGFATNPLNAPITLSDYGLDKKQAARLRAYGKLSAAEFEEQAAQMEKSGKTVLPCAAEKPRKKAPVIERKEEAVEAEFADADAALLEDDGDTPKTLTGADRVLDDDDNGDTYKNLYEKEVNAHEEARAALDALREEARALKEALAAKETRIAALEAGATDPVIEALKEENAALKQEAKEHKAELKTQKQRSDKWQAEAADLQGKYNGMKFALKKVCKATGYEFPKKESTYCTGSGYSDESDPRHIEWLNKQKEKALADELAKNKAAVNKEKREAATWLAQNHVPADDGYQFSGKQAAAQAAREPLADNSPKPAAVESKPKIPQSEWGKDALERPIVCNEARKLASINKLDIFYYFKCLDAGLSEAAALNCAKLTSPNPLLTQYGY